MRMPSRMLRQILGRLTARGVVAASIAMLSLAAEAHVKWFAAYDLKAAPLSPSAIWTSEFAQLALVAMFTLWVASVVETTRFGRALLIGLDLLTEPLRPRSDQFLRCSLAVFFTALWARGGIILTPELITGRPAVEWLQIAIAAGLFWRRSMILSGLGILGLYLYAVVSYGLFHLLDYPIFLGFAAYCILCGLRRDVTGMLPRTVMRWSIGITLMWASVEKWGYPAWTYPLLDQHPDIAARFSYPFFMTAAGMVEFGFAFALIWTPLVRRVAAMMLCAIFVSAIFDFGKIDAIGHLPIIAALVVIALEPRAPARYPLPSRLPVCFVAALVFFVAAYCAAHAVLMGGTGGLSQPTG